MGQHRPLSDRELKILSCVQLDATRSLASIARTVRLQTPTVRRIMKAFTETGLIRRFYYIDIYRLGYWYWDLYFSLDSHDAKSCQRALSLLTGHPQVAFVSELAGRFRYCATLMVREHEEVRTFLAKIADAREILFRERASAVNFSLTDFPLVGEREVHNAKSELAAGRSQKSRVQIDAEDAALLRELSAIGERTIATLARQLRVKETTLHARIAKLAANGVVVGARYFIDLSRVGMVFHINHVYAPNMTLADRERLRSFCSARALIYFFVEAQGPWDAVFGTAVHSSSELAEILNDVQLKFQGVIQRIETFTLCRLHKLCGFPGGGEVRRESNRRLGS